MAAAAVGAVGVTLAIASVFWDDLVDEYWLWKFEGAEREEKVEIARTLGERECAKFVACLVRQYAADEEFGEELREAFAVELDDLAPEVVPVLVGLLSDPIDDARRFAVSLLGDIGWPAVSAVPKLIERLDDPAEQVVLEAIEALGIVDGGGSLRVVTRALLRMAADPRPLVQLTAVVTVTGQGGSNPVPRARAVMLTQGLFPVVQSSTDWEVIDRALRRIAHCAWNHRARPVPGVIEKVAELVRKLPPYADKRLAEHCGTILLAHRDHAAPAAAAVVEAVQRTRPADRDHLACGIRPNLNAKSGRKMNTESGAI